MQASAERAAGATSNALRAALARLDRTRPVVVLAPLAVLQCISVVHLGLTAQHNGWVWYTGGDNGIYQTTAFALSHGRIPPAYIGYGMGVVTAPIAAVGGANMLRSLPILVALQLLVLVPLELVLVHAIARRIGGLRFGYAAAALWVLGPYLLLRFWRPDFRVQFHDLLLPNALGLTNMGDFPSLLLVLAGAWLTFRAMDERRRSDAVLAGLVLGFALAVKPAQALFLPAPALGLLAVRRPRDAVSYGLALVPAALTLTLWKYRGLGYLPILHAQGETREALGAAPGLLGANPIEHYFHFSWSHFSTNLAELREVGWSLRLAEYLPLAGLVGAFRRSPAKALVLAYWFAIYMVVKGGTALASVYTTSYFRLTLPGLPAYFLLSLCIVFLWPGVRPLRVPAAAGSTRVFTRGVVIAVALLVVLPLAVVSAARAGNSKSFVFVTKTHTIAPEWNDFRMRVRRVLVKRGPPGVEVTWDAPPHGRTAVDYAVYRGTGDGCAPSDVAAQCLLAMERVGYTALRRFVDEQGRPGDSYRVVLVAGHDPDKVGDDILFSRPVVVPASVPRAARGAARARRSGR